MKPIKLRVKNYAGYIEETFYFEKTAPLFCVVGHNGAGKSSFFVDAITICLFNQCRTSDSRGTGVENMIKLGEEYFEIEFEFEMNGQIINVLRRRYAKSQELELKINGVDHTEKIKETQNKINQIINMDYDTFMDTICIGQGKSGSFMEKKPDKRKEVFTKVLGLDKYDILEEETKELRKEQKNKITLLESKLNDLRESVNNKELYENQIKESEKQIKEINNKIKELEILLENELKEKMEYQQLVKQANEIIEKKNYLKNQINQIESSIKKGESIRKDLELVLSNKNEILSKLDLINLELEQLNVQQTKLLNEKSSLEATNQMLIKQDEELKNKYSRLKKYNKAECDFCGQPITESHKNLHLEQLLNEHKKIAHTVNQNNEKINHIKEQLNQINQSIFNKKNELNELQENKTKIVQAEAKLPSVINKLEELNQNLVLFKEEYNKIKDIEVETLQHKTFKDDIYKNQLNNLRYQLSDYQAKLAVATNEMKKIENDINKISELENEINENKKLLSVYDDLVTAWGKKGIQAIIIDNTLPEIQDEINKILSILSDDKVSIEFKTQKEKGSGKKITSIETLDIIVNDEEGSRIYETYSGGEKFRIDFACHVGLAKFLAKRAGSPIDFFIIDEGVGSQDEAAKRQFIIAVNKLTQIFSKVIVISHIQDVIESFKDRVEVYKDPIEGSKIRIIND